MYGDAKWEPSSTFHTDRLGILHLIWEHEFHQDSLLTRYENEEDMKTQRRHQQKVDHQEAGVAKKDRDAD